MLLNSSLRTPFVQPNHPPTGLILPAKPPEVSSVPFARFPHALAADTRLSPTERLIGCALLFWARDRPIATMSNRSLAKYLGVSLSVIERGLRALARLGYIVCEAIRATMSNATGRIVHLTWVENPSVLPAVPIRRALEVTGGEGTSLVTGGPVAYGGEGTSLATGEASSGVTDKGDRFVEKLEKLENARADEVQRQRSEAIPPIAAELAVEPETPVELVEVLEAIDQDLPVPVVEQVEPSNLTEGQRAMMASLTPDEAEVFAGMSANRQATLLAPHATGFDPSFLRISRSELRPRPKRPELSQATSTAEIIAAVAAGDYSSTVTLAESLCRDFAGPGDRKRWGAIHRMTQQLLRREIRPDDVLDAHRQAMGPKAENRGAVFTYALKRSGWKPESVVRM